MRIWAKAKAMARSRVVSWAKKTRLRPPSPRRAFDAVAARYERGRVGRGCLGRRLRRGERRRGFGPIRRLRYSAECAGVGIFGVNRQDFVGELPDSGPVLAVGGFLAFVQETLYSPPYSLAHHDVRILDDSEIVGRARFGLGRRIMTAPPLLSAPHVGNLPSIPIC